MSELNQIEALSTQVKELIVLTQDKNDKLEKANESLKNSLEKDISEIKTEIGDSMEKCQKLEGDKKALETSIKNIEAHINRTPLGAGNSQSNKVNEFKQELDSYLRTGDVNIDNGLIKEYGETYISKNLPHIKDGAEKDAILQYLTKGNSVTKGYLILPESKTLSVDSNPDGGYTVLPQRNPNIQNIREFESSEMRSIATVISTANESYEEVIDDDESFSGGWVSEKQSRPTTGTPQIGTLEFHTHEQYAEPKITQKILDDASINIESYLSAKTNDIITRTENTTFVSGDGAGKPRGFLDYAATSGTAYERGKIERINSGSNGNFVPDTIKKLKNSLKGRYQARAVFTIKRAEWFNIITQKNGTGDYLLDRNSFKDSDTNILLGKPVILFDDMPDSATGSLSMAYGDFGAGYIIIDRIGIRVIRDNVTEKGFIKFYTTKRVGGGVKNFEAIKLYKLSN